MLLDFLIGLEIVAIVIVGVKLIKQYIELNLIETEGEYIVK